MERLAICVGRPCSGHSCAAMSARTISSADRRLPTVNVTICECDKLSNCPRWPLCSLRELWSLCARFDRSYGVHRPPLARRAPVTSAEAPAEMARVLESPAASKSRDVQFGGRGGLEIRPCMAESSCDDVILKAESGIRTRLVDCPLRQCRASAIIAASRSLSRRFSSTKSVILAAAMSARNIFAVSWQRGRDESPHEVDTGEP